MTMQIFLGEVLEAFKFEEDHKYKDYKMGGFEAKGCYFQLGPMGVNNIPIEGNLFLRNLFVTREGEMVDGLVQFFCQK